MSPHSVLNLRFYSHDLGQDVSIRQYLQALLIKLFQEQESFSGKRPFGESGWTHDLEKFFIQQGFMQGTLTPDGYIETSDGTFKLKVAELIKAL